MFTIGIAGPAQSGKSSIANELFLELNQTDTWDITSFAEPIKAMIEAMGIDNPDQYKTTPHPIFGVTTREMYQTLGTQWAQRLMGKDVWIKALKTRVNEDSNVIISDVRFEHEADFIREHGVLIHVLGRGGIGSNHTSEAGIAIDPNDWCFINNNEWSYVQSQISIFIKALHFSSRILRSRA